jgi:hypothetical protein
MQLMIFTSAGLLLAQDWIQQKDPTEGCHSYSACGGFFLLIELCPMFFVNECVYHISMSNIMHTNKELMKRELSMQ